MSIARACWVSRELVGATPNAEAMVEGEMKDQEPRPRRVVATVRPRTRQVDGEMVVIVKDFEISYETLKRGMERCWSGSKSGNVPSYVRVPRSRRGEAFGVEDPNT